MLIRRAPDLRWSDVTDHRLYMNRRQFVRATIGTALAATVWPTDGAQAQAPLSGIRPSPFSTSETRTPWEDVTTYNNFYEFGTDKADPARQARRFRPKPWTVKVDGLVARPADYALDDLVKPHALEERIYRLRCVEGWSMVIPWVGIPLGDVIKRLNPLPSATHVEFTTLHDPRQMPGQSFPVLAWPYVEGLRMDEALHPLTLLAVGLYGQTLPNQNGAPLRVVVPWKYGFKSIKTIVRMRFLDRQPLSSWQRSAPQEYGFFANVNPEVDHPRWSQARERRLGEFFKRKTLPFNGYGDQVAALYAGLDLRRYY